ncbi:MAG: endonuclease domain-containing protein [Bacteroides sp.]|nr:endonuclease domain-containing protein [Roseburia sp.]MCM1346208.1 endonuclease domain-containing protein [Bacteroides sp.]MCM1419965.1 endonuclease domain-containing protein [Bacteroides sp.]
MPEGDSKQKSMNLPEYKSLRRQLRTYGTSAEARLWTIIKAGQIDGLRFRRQYSVGNFILDFYCPCLRLCIELDGEVHFNEESYNNDLKRTEYLWTHHGIKVFRYENKTVFDYPASIIEDIRTHRNEFCGGKA